jgi:penicillin-binding protein 1C
LNSKAIFHFNKKRKIIFYIFSISILSAYWFCLPKQLFNDPTSTVINDRTGILIGAKIADDGQWRFPKSDSIPFKFKTSLLRFEDRHFYQHPGVNPVSIFRAFYQNIQSGKIVSGGSTLTMQVIRLSRKGKPRSIYEKIREIILAMRLELTHSKEEIISLYASNAPFGGNVVGLEAASWRYFGCNPEELSWAESATLAVLPNAPSLIYPGKNHDRLLRKRNKLLNQLLQIGELDTLECQLAKAEPLPEKPLALEQSAPHLLSRIYQSNKGGKTGTTLDYALQNQLAEIIEKHHAILKFNQVHNAAAIVVEVETGNVLAYVGNTRNPGNPEHGSDVDIIRAHRSSGSILKPILYAAMQDDGEILPNTLIPDIPAYYGGYSPKNFDLKYSGAVPASKALSRSLNVPAVRMLRQYGYPRFYHLLKNLGIKSLNHPPDHYGLSLILGGSEVSLWELAGIYSSFSRVLNHYYKNQGLNDENDWRMPNFENHLEIENEKPELKVGYLLSPASIWLTFKALLEVNRPQELSGWKSFSSSEKIAWKTGTSFGFRDAWAIGITPEYVVAVWAGNADGEGRSGLTGVSAAAPIMFDIFNILPNKSWYDPPYDEMSKVIVCRQSGHRASSICDPVDTVWIHSKGEKTTACPYHRLIHLDKTKTYRVNSNCYDPNEMEHTSWFVLPPVWEWYYKTGHPLYHPLPPLLPGCKKDILRNPMEFIYPAENTKLYIPIELDGNPGSIIFEAAHHNENASIYWHLDKKYLGLTKQPHQLSVQATKGKHILTLVDNEGNVLKKQIEILKKVR